jgi:tetratricopeptide (TPR) repeat protein
VATASAAPITPLFGNLGDHHRRITTSSKQAQSYFDQGLVFAYAFNHDEAIRSFQRAAALDPECAMPWWGIALANGPHINNPAMDREHSEAAWAALEQARARAGGSSATERALIEALGARYASPPPDDRRPLDEGYAAAMRALWKANPGDADIGTLCAEALMDLQPWDLWTPENAPKGNTSEILATLERVLEMAPNHPGANHLYVHAVEASPFPERGLPSADRLTRIVPGAGHLVHMPAHIYSRLGRWADAVRSNEQAVEADRAYRARSPHHAFYRIYMAHNHHFLSWAAMMEGRSELAIRAAREMIAGVPEDFLRSFAGAADGYMAIEIEALVRFGKWEELLALPRPAEYLPITIALWHFGRGAALAATDRTAEARREQEAFTAASARVTESMTVGNNPAKQVIAIADHALAGEIAYREGKIDDAVARLSEAVRIEDQLKYNEAPDWIQPMRHTLGGVLLAAKRFEEAEAVYRADLVKNPHNGWALFGVLECLRARAAAGDAAAQAQVADAQARFDAAWARADIPLEVTCFCLQKRG